MDVMDVGRMAVILDPTGGVVSLWEAKSHQGFGRVNEPTMVTWCELMTDDADRAADFFTAILDVPHQTMNMGPDAPPYILLGPAGEQRAGLMTKTPEMCPMPNVWCVYFEVADTDAATTSARNLGATVLQEPADIMPGRFAILRDPQGAVFGIIKSSPMQAYAPADRNAHTPTIVPSPARHDGGCATSDTAESHQRHRLDRIARRHEHVLPADEVDQPEAIEHAAYLRLNERQHGALAFSTTVLHHFLQREQPRRIDVVHILHAQNERPASFRGQLVLERGGAMEREQTGRGEDGDVWPGLNQVAQLL